MNSDKCLWTVSIYWVLAASTVWWSDLDINLSLTHSRWQRYTCTTLLQLLVRGALKWVNHHVHAASCAVNSTGGCKHKGVNFHFCDNCHVSQHRLYNVMYESQNSIQCIVTYLCVYLRPAAYVHLFLNICYCLVPVLACIGNESMFKPTSVINTDIPYLWIKSVCFICIHHYMSFQLQGTFPC